MRYWIIIPTLLFFACKNNVEITPQPPIIVDQHMCSAACANLQSLKCEDGNYIDSKKHCDSTYECIPGQLCMSGTCHTSCEDFCIETQNAGVWLDPTCVSKINSCPEIDSCPQTKNK